MFLKLCCVARDKVTNYVYVFCIFAAYTIPKEEFNLAISDITPKFTLSHLSVNIEHYT